MKKIIFRLLSIVALLALTVGGLELFSHYEASENINTEAPVQTIQTITIHASPEKVYSIMTHVNQWAGWQHDIQEPSMIGTFQKGNSFTWKSNGLSIRSNIQTAIPNQKIGWAGPAFGSFAIHNWRFVEKDSCTTEVIVEESMEGWLIALMRNKFQKGLEASLQIWMKNLKAEAEKSA